MKRIILLFSVPGLIFTVCIHTAGAQTRIAVSKVYQTYEKWLLQSDTAVSIINMYGLPVDSAVAGLSHCQGLLLTGGEDVNPAIYGKADELPKCEAIDNYRDTLELALIKEALAEGIPVFGVCRGAQILNVAFGGTLITDIPSFRGTRVIHRNISGDSFHGIRIEVSSELSSVTKVREGLVNSAHHQAVDSLAPGLRIAASGEDGIVEAIERKYPGGKSFVMGVQWHPERLEKNPALSGPLADYFLGKIQEYCRIKQIR